MTKSALREKFGRLGAIEAIDLVPSGSREVVALSLGPDIRLAKTITATLALRKRHVPMLKAKRAVEAALEQKSVVLVAPVVEDLKRLAAELVEAGFALAALTPKSVDVKQLRERLGLTQEDFALRFGLDVDAVRNWEYGRREPDRAAKSYLAVIDREPERAQAALATPIL
jgi:DNA-binding transcriptional regulator YiaG